MGRSFVWWRKCLGQTLERRGGCVGEAVIKRVETRFDFFATSADKCSFVGIQFFVGHLAPSGNSTTFAFDDTAIQTQFFNFFITQFAPLESFDKFGRVFLGKTGDKFDFEFLFSV